MCLCVFVVAHFHRIISVLYQNQAVWGANKWKELQCIPKSSMIRRSDPTRVITVELKEVSWGATWGCQGLERVRDGPTLFVTLQICISSSEGTENQGWKMWLEYSAAAPWINKLLQLKVGVQVGRVICWETEHANTATAFKAFERLNWDSFWMLSGLSHSSLSAEGIFHPSFINGYVAQLCLKYRPLGSVLIHASINTGPRAQSSCSWRVYRRRCGRCSVPKALY